MRPALEVLLARSTRSGFHIRKAYPDPIHGHTFVLRKEAKTCSEDEYREDVMRNMGTYAS